MDHVLGFPRTRAAALRGFTEKPEKSLLKFPNLPE